MASSSKQSDLRVMLIPLPKYSPGPLPSLFGWSFQVQAILHLSKETDQVKSASLLNVIPAEILTKIFGKNFDIEAGSLDNLLNSWLWVLRDLRRYFKDPDTEIEFYNSLQAPTKTVPL